MMQLYQALGQRFDDETIAAIADMEAFESLNYRVRSIVSEHLGFCRACYATCFYDKNDLDESGQPKRKQRKSHPFVDLALDHGLASPDTADKTFRWALKKMKKALLQIQPC